MIKRLTVFGLLLILKLTKDAWEVIMAYPTLKKLNEQIDKLANRQEPNEAGMITVCMYNLRRMFLQNTTFYIGNRNYTFMITSNNKIKCDIRYIRPEAPAEIANILSTEIEKFLNNPQRISDKTHAVFDFLREAEIRTEYFNFIDLK